MALQHVDELAEPPVVGRRYLVPTVTYPWHGRTDAWPVMGPKHTDAEHLHFYDPHYHVDLRFLSARQVRFASRQIHGADATVLVARAPLARRTEHDWRQVIPHPDPVHRALSCRRADHDYPLGLTLSTSGFRALHAAFAGRRCARNSAGLLICPHKGFALDTLVPDAEGRVVCPLHGLVIDKAGGVVVGSEAHP